MATQDMLELMKASGYYMTDGHFRLVSGKHSDTYVQVRLSMMDPSTCDSFVKIGRGMISTSPPTAVAAFTVGGLLLADAISKTLGIPLVRGRKRASTVEWINSDDLNSQTRVLVVDDVLTTASQVNIALSSLEETNVGAVLGVLIAVDRSSETPQLFFRGNTLPVFSCVRLPLTLYDPSSCHLCRIGIPPTDLSNPERNFISVLLSQPAEKSEFILRGYERVYRMQEEHQLIDEIKAWKPWLPVLIAGLPIARMEEDSRLIRFVSYLTYIAQEYHIKPRVLSELVGQLLSLSSIRVESRAVGCSILIGAPSEMHRFLESKARANLPIGVSCEDLKKLIPYFDAFSETHFAMLFDREGAVVDLRRLIYSLPNIHKEGIELLRFVTSRTSSLAFALRRGRHTITVYGNGRLEAVVELSERTGLWEFSRPMERIDEITSSLPWISETLAMVVEAGRELIAKGHGGLFIIGKTKGLKYTKPKVDIEPQFLQEMPIEDLVELAKLDGAVIINEKGELTHVTVIIQNTVESQSLGTPAFYAHGGSRKETARRTSIECPECATVYVSQNGAIEVYIGENSWSLAEGVPGLASS